MAAALFRRVVEGGDPEKENAAIPRPAPAALIYAPALVDRALWASLTRLERRFVEALREWHALAPARAREVVRRVPVSLRGLAWRQITGSLALERPNRARYAAYAAAAATACDADIAKDVRRTRPGSSAAAQAALERLMRAYAAMRPDVGYCQGMSYVLALCLDVAGGENEAFWLFAQLVDNHALRGFWQDGLPLVQLALYALDRLVGVRYPALFSHMKELGVTPLLYASAWFSSLFAYNFPPALTARIWDVFLVEGITYLLRVALAIVALYHDRLLPLGFDALINTLKHAPAELDTERVVRTADDMTFVTAALVCQLKDEFNSPAMANERRYF